MILAKWAVTSNPGNKMSPRALSRFKAHVKHGYGYMTEELMPDEGKYLQSITDATKYSIIFTTYGLNNIAIIDPKTV